MNATFKLANVDECQASITLTLSIKEWREVRSQLDTITTVSKWPTQNMLFAIDDLLRQADKTLWADGSAVADDKSLP